MTTRYTAVTDGLTTIRDAITDLAMARVDATGHPATGFAVTLDTLDAMIHDWDHRNGPPTADDTYRLGLLVGMVAYMSACRVDHEGEIIPMPVNYPDGNPVARAAVVMRDAVVSFEAPEFA